MPTRGGATGASSITVERLPLGAVEFPEWHPRFAEGGCPVFGYVVRHPDGVILFDTGVGIGNEFIDALYRPHVVAIDEALAAIGIDERDVIAVVNSHLHFDHCGQNDVFHRHGIPIYVQAAEAETCRTVEHYTVPEWAAVPEACTRMVRGDEQLADGVRIVETPGHTPGHQSLVVDGVAGRTVVAGQCVYKVAEAGAVAVAADNMHDEHYEEAGQQSLERLLALAPGVLVAAHDTDEWRKQ